MRTPASPLSTPSRFAGVALADEKIVSRETRPLLRWFGRVGLAQYSAAASLRVGKESTDTILLGTITLNWDYVRIVDFDCN